MKKLSKIKKLVAMTVATMVVVGSLPVFAHTGSVVEELVGIDGNGNIGRSSYSGAVGFNRHAEANGGAYALGADVGDGTKALSLTYYAVNGLIGSNQLDIAFKDVPSFENVDNVETYITFDIKATSDSANQTSVLSHLQVGLLPNGDCRQKIKPYVNPYNQGWQTVKIPYSVFNTTMEVTGVCFYFPDDQPSYANIPIYLKNVKLVAEPKNFNYNPKFNNGSENFKILTNGTGAVEAFVLDSYAKGDMTNVEIDGKNAKYVKFGSKGLVDFKLNFNGASNLSIDDYSLVMDVKLETAGDYPFILQMNKSIDAYYNYDASVSISECFAPTTEWQKVVIPLVQYWGGNKLNDYTHFCFIYDNVGTGNINNASGKNGYSYAKANIYISDVAIVKNSDMYTTDTNESLMKDEYYLFGSSFGATAPLGGYAGTQLFKLNVQDRNGYNINATSTLMPDSDADVSLMGVATNDGNWDNRYEIMSKNSANAVNPRASSSLRLIGTANTKGIAYKLPSGLITADNYDDMYISFDVYTNHKGTGEVTLYPMKGVADYRGVGANKFRDDANIAKTTEVIYGTPSSAQYGRNVVVPLKNIALGKTAQWSNKADDNTKTYINLNTWNDVGAIGIVPKMTHDAYGYVTICNVKIGRFVNGSVSYDIYGEVDDNLAVVTAENASNTMTTKYLVPGMFLAAKYQKDGFTLKGLQETLIMPELYINPGVSGNAEVTSEFSTSASSSGYKIFHWNNTTEMAPLDVELTSK